MRRWPDRGLPATCTSSHRSTPPTRTPCSRRNQALQTAAFTWPTSKPRAAVAGQHAWTSPPGSGLYVSILLRPRIAPADILWLSLAAGLAVHDAIQTVTSLQPDLRWPNDLLFGSRKFCGILTELNAEVTRVRHAVIGIGINVHQPQFPPELRSIAGFVVHRDRPQLAASGVAPRLVAEPRSRADRPQPIPPTAAESIRARLEQRSSWIRGKRVLVEEGEPWTGVTDGLDPRGFLQVRTGSGLRTVLSGGVREAKA